MGIARMINRAVSLPDRLLESLLAAPTTVHRVHRNLRTTTAQAVGVLPDVIRVVARLHVVLDEVEALAGRTTGVVRSAQTTTRSVAAVSTDAAAAVAMASEEIRRCHQLLGLYESALTDLAPVVTAAASELEPHHLHAVVQALDLVPGLVDLVPPALENLADLTPELGQLNDRLDSVGEIVEGIPGADRLRRRTQAAAHG